MFSFTTGLARLGELINGLRLLHGLTGTLECMSTLAFLFTCALGVKDLLLKSALLLGLLLENEFPV